ncbi:MULTISPECIES: c-type cytochrome [unclassified Lysobacter]|uniref:c-type cytochrome n=1 Tax=unclassified Lysobacter TaxID=2635362 RepID=UPI0006F2525A|nr:MULTISPECIES: c-type cytochrome [unclassified Lysobacter]KRA16406.1 cytochrome C [Lysobacter sp. Root604]KRD75978.1 cytochrome C [Lysobacter sp. Root983]
MSQARVLGIVGLTVLAAVAVAYAQPTITPIPDKEPVQAAPLVEKPASWGDVKAGATKAGTCAACHGLDGNPTDPQYPRLAGQSERYIAHQIALFKSGERNTGMAAAMKPYADALTAQDARDLGAYFATQKSGAGVADDTVIATGPNKDKKFFEVGQQLFLAGDKARGIPACMACHGPGGAGNPGPAYPHIAGQQAAYSQRRLEEYRAGTTTQRDPHLFNVMAGVAKNLSDEEIGALSSYLQGLHDRAEDFAAADAPAAPAAAAPAAAPAPAAPAPAAPAKDDAAKPAAGA